MIKRYGDGAATEATMRADEFLDQGNLDGERLWMRIMQTIEELQRERPRDGVAVGSRLPCGPPSQEINGASESQTSSLGGHRVNEPVQSTGQGTRCTSESI